ncbi:MAG TPA: diguanylate cyclase [Terriglobales bacterium]|nr:diguanylate cyclase [Terriglobales bacterium]
MKILLVEDSAVDQCRIGGFLKKWNLPFTAMDNGAKAWDLLQSPQAPDLLLVDWMLPGMDGLELCRNVRTLAANGNYIYTVMLTAKQNKADLLTAMAAGADDYLTKPVDAADLRARIMVGKRIIELQQSLKFAATHDFLTHLLNRAEIMCTLRRELSRSERDRNPVSIALADLDHFKGVNDSLGHAAGDIVLKEVAHRLQSELRPYDFVGRYGGEEFLLILPSCPSTIAARRADEVRGAVASGAVISTFAKISVTVSIGVVGTDLSPGCSTEELLQLADDALYRAKSKGRNRVETAVAGATASVTK